VPEKDHIVAAFRFELSKVDVPDIRQRMVDNLAHVDLKLAARVAAPLGIKPPDPKAAAGRLGFRDYRITSKVEEDPALRMVGRPGGSAKNAQGGHPGGRRCGSRQRSNACNRT
jgi:catalase